MRAVLRVLVGIGIAMVAGAAAWGDELDLSAYRSAILAAANANEFSGAVLLAEGDDILLAEAYGLANRSYGIPNSLETRFDLASIGKLFTTVAILKLVETGQVSLDDTLSEYLDESWIRADYAAKIKLRHILTHATGLGNFFTDGFFGAARTRYRKLSDFKPLIHAETLAFEPGEGFGYSNTAMVLAGAVIEAVSNQRYADFIQSHIFDPAGMAHTGCFAADEPHPNIAVGYFKDEDQPGHWKNNLFLNLIVGGPAGGCRSTVGDMHRFGVSIMKGGVLSSELTRDMFTAQPAPEGVRIGYGFFLGKDSTDRTAAHGGFFPGVSGSFDLYLDRGLISVILSNASDGAPPIRSALKAMVAAE